MATITLTVAKRKTEEKAHLLRKAGDIPGIIYGNKMDAISIKCKERDLRVAFTKAGQSTLVEIDIDGKKIPSLVHAIAFEPVAGGYEHVDFFAVDMTKKVTAQVPLVLDGESPAVKELGGVLVTVHHTVTVRCLPKDLPRELHIDLSTLKELRDTVTVSKLSLPEGVTIEESPETVLIIAQEKRKEEVAEVVAVAPAEGEAAAAAGAEGAAAGAAPAAGAAAAPAAKKEEKKK